MLPILSYIHIPKMAGTSARVALMNAAGAENVLAIGLNISPDEFGKAGPSDVQGKRVLFGHADADRFRRIGVPMKFATTVRDPVSRAISYFHFMKVRRPDSPLSKRLQNRTLEQACRQVQPFIQNISNKQCRMICGEPSAEMAIETLLREDWFISTSDRLDELTGRICKHYGWSWTEAPRQNVGKKDYRARVTTPAAEAIIAELNTEDAKLFDFVARMQSAAPATP